MHRRITNTLHAVAGLTGRPASAGVGAQRLPALAR